MPLWCFLLLWVQTIFESSRSHIGPDAGRERASYMCIATPDDHAGARWPPVSEAVTGRVVRLARLALGVVTSAVDGAAVGVSGGGSRTALGNALSSVFVSITSRLAGTIHLSHSARKVAGGGRGPGGRGPGPRRSNRTPRK